MDIKCHTASSDMNDTLSVIIETIYYGQTLHLVNYVDRLLTLFSQNEAFSHSSDEVVICS